MDAAQMPKIAVKGGVVPYLMLDGARKAAEFYQKAFAAEIAYIFPEDEKGRTMHAHIYLNGTSLMVSDPYPEHGAPYVPAAGFSLMIEVDDVEAWWKRAVDAGVEVVMPLADQFWGARYGQVKCPFGIIWALSQNK